VISNSGTTFAESASSSTYNNFFFDFVRFEANVPPSKLGMSIIFR